MSEAAIWIPGFGVTNLTARRVNAAVAEYDENLIFGQNPQTQQWCILRKLPPDTIDEYGMTVAGQRVIPILGFSDVPHPEDALKRLYRADAWRRGSEILDSMNKENEDLKKPRDQAAKDAAGIAAEGFEWGFRAMGKSDRAVVALNEKKSGRMGGYS